ncbi:MAG: CRTAC1 family protein [Verrucomicrobia bacterium]|nr:CRTAC1 family protein [Verrucomicrobiota bacterium]
MSATGTYQWRFNGVELPGETGTTLVLTNIQLAHQGRYSVVVGTGDGGTTTNFTYLTVDPQFSTVSEGPLVATRESGWSCNWWDFDRDGNLDLFVPNGAEASSNEASALFRGDGQGGFTRVSESEGGPLVSDRGRWTVAACGDYDNDGFDDVVVASWTAGQPIRLYRSRAGGGFEKVLNPASFGPGWGTPTWGDYDLDGWLDLYIGSGEYSVAATRPVLWHNEGGGVFVEVRNSPAVTSPFADTMAATWTDYDGDGDPDLFVTDHTLQQVALYRNSGHGDLTRTSAGSLTSDRFTALVPAFADYDNDGDLDVLVSGYTGSTRLYGNTGDGQFALQFSMSGTEAGRPAWGDYDNDGYLDFYLPQGQGGPVANQFWRNNGDGTFLPLTIGSPAGDVGYSPAASWGDYDNDGFLDLFVPGNKGEVDHLYHNNGNSNSWLMVNLLGTVSNRSAIGAKVRVWATLGGKRVWQMRELSGGNRAQDDPRAHFGLGTAPAADIVRIEWPSGIVQELRNVPAKQILTVTEPPALEALGEGRVRILCWARQSYEVEASDNLQTWHTLGVTDTDQSRPVVLDPGAAGKSHRFYRAKGL